MHQTYLHIKSIEQRRREGHQVTFNSLTLDVWNKSSMGTLQNQVKDESL